MTHQTTAVRAPASARTRRGRILLAVIAIGAAIWFATTAARHLSVRAEAPAQDPVRLTVVGGNGGGNYQPGDTVRIEPQRMPDMRVFDRWQSPADAVRWSGAADIAHLSFTMPDRDTTVTATWKAAPLWSLEPVAVSGTTVYRQAPDFYYTQRGGVLVLLHDAGSGADFWRQSTEARLFERAAVAHGHGLLVLESSDRATGRWDISSAGFDTNPDLRRLIDAIHAAEFSGLPLVLVGIGQGGDFAALAARAMAPLSSVHPVATVLVGAAGDAVPVAGAMQTLFVVAERDDAALNERIHARQAALTAAGVKAEILTLPPWPMFPLRFWRIDGYTAQDSREAYKVLLNVGALDATGWVSADPSGMPEPGLPEDLKRTWPFVREQLTVGWAGHGFSSHATEAILRFAMNRWGLPIPLPTASPTRLAYAAYVTVTNGSAGRSEYTGWDGGMYADRDVVHIWADPDPAGQVFDHWTGDADTLADARARHTTFMIRRSFYKLTAVYRPAPEWQPAERQMDGRQVFFHAPPNPVGLIFFFHGAGGSSAGWTAPRNVENTQLLRDAVMRGYAIAVTESGDRQGKQWSPAEPAANEDMQHVARLHAQLLAEGAIPAGLPVFGVGMSNGGGFVSRVADALGWQGAAVYAAACRPALAETTTVPLAWRLAEQDRRVSNQDAHACHMRLKARGVDTDLRVNGPSPVYPDRFLRGPGVTGAESRAVYAALKTARLLDRLDFQVLPPSEAGWPVAIEGLPNAPLAVISEQLAVCWAEHQFFSDFDHLTLDFFDRQRGAESTATPSPTTTRTPTTPTATETKLPRSVGWVVLPVGYSGR
jgi:dienelactone hydrolase